MYAGSSAVATATGGAGGSAGAGGGGGGSGSGSSAAHSAQAASHSSAIAEANDLDALVFEFGTSKCKFGYAGEDFPRVYESPVQARAGEDERASVRRAARMESDYEAVAQWLFDAASARLDTKLSEHPLLLVERPFPIPDEFIGDGAGDAEPGSASVSGDQVSGASASAAADAAVAHASSAKATKKRDFKARERFVEVLMEHMDLPALFCAKSSVLTCYANARTSGLVVEMGATYTSITSVHEGYAFAYPKSQMLLYGGHDLDAFLRYKLDAQLRVTSPPPTSASAPTSPLVGSPSSAKKPRLAAVSELRGSSQYYWSLAVETKESGLCRVADGPFDEAQNTQLPKISYELPDKTIVQLGTERFSVAEQFFTPPSTISGSVTAGSAAGESSGDALSTMGEIVKDFDSDTARQFGVKRGIALPELVIETGALTTEAELRKEMFQNIVLTGGSSCFENLPTRLEREIIVALSSFQSGAGGSAGASGAGTTSGFAVTPGLGNMRVKLIAAHAQERRIGSFLGGSILASLGSFHEMWMSKAEYAEHGAALIHKKCP